MTASDEATQRTPATEAPPTTRQQSTTRQPRGNKPTAHNRAPPPGRRIQRDGRHSTAPLSTMPLQALLSASIHTAISSAVQGLTATLDSRVRAAVQEQLGQQQRDDGTPPDATGQSGQATTYNLPLTAGSSAMDPNPGTPNSRPLSVSPSLPPPSSITGIPLIATASNSGAGLAVAPLMTPSPTTTKEAPQLLSNVQLAAPTAGPCATPVDAKLAQKIWWGDYIDMAALLPESLNLETEEEAKGGGGP